MPQFLETTVLMKIGQWSPPAHKMRSACRTGNAVYWLRLPNSISEISQAERITSIDMAALDALPHDILEKHGSVSENAFFKPKTHDL